MARKTRAAGERTRERILAAALPLFAEHGFAGTSTRMVAGAAEVNVATLAYYFEGKEGLYNAVVQRLHEDLAEAMPTEFPPEALTDPARWLADTAWDFAVEHRVHIRLLIRGVLDSGRHHEAIMERWSDMLLDRASELIGRFRPDMPPVRRRLTVISLQHSVARLAIEDREQLAQMTGHPVDLDEEIRTWIAHQIRLHLGMG